MQVRAVLIGAGVVAVAIICGQYRAGAQVPSQPPLLPAHGNVAYAAVSVQGGQNPAPKSAAGGGATSRGARGAAGGSRTVRNLTPQQIFDYQMASDAAGDPAAGRAIFEKSCAKCHKFGSIGNLVGPELTMLKSRFKKKDVLEAILWASKSVGDQYQAVVIETKDGESRTGIVAREDPTWLLLKTAEDPERGITIPKANITDRRVTDRSLMPDGLVKDMTQRDITNLVAFLLSSPA